MMPLPWHVGPGLSLALQQTAIELTSHVMESLGQSALAEGNAIHINEFSLEVAKACSELRIFVGLLP